MIIFIFMCPAAGDSRIEESLRMASSFIGMDSLPVIVFTKGAVRCLLPGVLKGRLYEYLRVATDLSSVNVLAEDLEEHDLTLEDLDDKLSVHLMDSSELSNLLSEGRVVVTF
ncbi:MAG: hypothetical protein ACLFVP_01015 [Candidatus Bathyarchaeia archaeon]